MNAIKSRGVPICAKSRKKMIFQVTNDGAALRRCHLVRLMSNKLPIKQLIVESREHSFLQF